jgi:hypothetical protein
VAVKPAAKAAAKITAKLAVNVSIDVSVSGAGRRRRRPSRGHLGEVIGHQAAGRHGVLCLNRGQDPPARFEFDRRGAVMLELRHEVVQPAYLVQLIGEARRAMSSSRVRQSGVARSRTRRSSCSPETWCAWRSPDSASWRPPRTRLLGEHAPHPAAGHESYVTGTQTVPSRYALNLSLCRFRLRAEERIDCAACFGFANVELWWPFDTPELTAEQIGELHGVL